LVGVDGRTDRDPAPNCRSVLAFRVTVVHPERVSETEWFATDQELAATPADIERELHDAWLDFDSMDIDAARTIISGHRERPVNGRWFMTGRYPVELAVSGAESVNCDDPDGLGGVGVDNVTIDDRGMTITSCYVGSLTILGAHLSTTLVLAGRPTTVRRWPLGRWRPDHS